MPEFITLGGGAAGRGRSRGPPPFGYVIARIALDANLIACLSCSASRDRCLATRSVWFSKYFRRRSSFSSREAPVLSSLSLMLSASFSQTPPSPPRELPCNRCAAAGLQLSPQ